MQTSFLQRKLDVKDIQTPKLFFRLNCLISLIILYAGGG